MEDEAATAGVVGYVVLRCDDCMMGFAERGAGYIPRWVPPYRGTAAII